MFHFCRSNVASSVIFLSSRWQLVKYVSSTYISLMKSFLSWFCGGNVTQTFSTDDGVLDNNLSDGVLDNNISDGVLDNNLSPITLLLGDFSIKHL